MDDLEAANEVILPSNILFDCGDSIAESLPPENLFHPHVNQEPPQNGTLEIPNYNTFLGEDSELGEMPPEVNPVSSMPEDESQLQPEEPNEEPTI